MRQTLITMTSNGFRRVTTGFLATHIPQLVATCSAFVEGEVDAPPPIGQA